MMPLSQLTRSELEFLRKAIKRRQIPTPISETALQSVGKGKLYARLGPLAGAHEQAALALIELALEKDPPAARPDSAAPAATLVWTGPEARGSRARPTTAMVLELFASARERVVVAGYEFDHGAVIFEPLHKAMQERGVAAAINVDIRPAPSPRTRMDAHLALEADRFLKRNWPFGPPYPQLYYLAAGAEHGSDRSLHAKCIVVDGERVLVGSANFTRRGHARNVEVGVQVDDAALAADLTGQLEGLVEQGALVPLPGPGARALPPADAEDEESDEAPAAPGPQAEQLAGELYVSAEARPLFVRVVAAGYPVPRVGEDVEGPGGEVIGSPELSWPEARVVALLPEQEGSRRKLEAAGWTCFAIDLDAEELGALYELVGRAG